MTVFLLGPAAEHVLEELELGLGDGGQEEGGPEGSEPGGHCIYSDSIEKWQ